MQVSLQPKHYDHHNSPEYLFVWNGSQLADFLGIGYKSRYWAWIERIWHCCPQFAFTHELPYPKPTEEFAKMAMKHGQEHENDALAELNKVISLKFKGMPDLFVANTTAYKTIGLPVYATPDAISTESNFVKMYANNTSLGCWRSELICVLSSGGRICVEFKCPYTSHYTYPKSHHLVQVIAEIVATHSVYGLFCIYRVDQPLIVFRISVIPNAGIWRYICKELKEFSDTYMGLLDLKAPPTSMPHGYKPKLVETITNSVKIERLQ